MIKIVIDPGHGGSDRANVGPTGYVEADGVLQIAKYLREELLSTGQIEVALTREVDKTLSLIERGKMGAGVDLFLSEHTNAFDKKQRGAEVFYSVDLPADNVVAQKLSAAVAATLGIPDRGAKTRESEKYPGEDYYTVIDTAQDYGAKHVMLIESAFHDNVADEAILKVDANLKKIAQAQAKVICDLLGAIYPPVPATPALPIQFEHDIKYLAGKVGIGESYWSKKEKIDPYFAELINKMANYIKVKG